jgi:hypothetical protein
MVYYAHNPNIGDNTMTEINIPSYSLISYYRDKKNNPRGVLVAILSEKTGDYNIGFSQCRKSDKFSKNMALKIALGRAKDEHIETWHNVPRNIRKMLPEFVKRCERYYNWR